MDKKYDKPEINVVEVETTNIMDCSICGHPGNHYGHHKHDIDNDEQ